VYSSFTPHTEAAYRVLAVKRMVRINLIYTVPTEEPTIAGIGCSDNRHLNGPVASIVRNMGDPSADVHESGSRGLETTPENLGCA
jgi:hypothetical protein